MPHCNGSNCLLEALDRAPVWRSIFHRFWKSDFEMAENSKDLGEKLNRHCEKQLIKPEVTFNLRLSIEAR